MNPQKKRNTASYEETVVLFAEGDEMTTIYPDSASLEDKLDIIKSDLTVLMKQVDRLGRETASPELENAGGCHLESNLPY